MPLLVIVRGLPGAGKSLYAHTFYPQCLHLSDDNTKIGDAHKKCINDAAIALSEGRDVVIASTFMRKRDVDSYVLPLRVMLRDKNMRVEVVHVVGDSFIHGMRHKWERYNGEVLVTPDNTRVLLDIKGREYISIVSMFENKMGCPLSPLQARQVGIFIANNIHPKGKIDVNKNGKNVQMNWYTPDMAPAIHQLIQMLFTDVGHIKPKKDKAKNKNKQEQK